MDILMTSVLTSIMTTVMVCGGLYKMGFVKTKGEGRPEEDPYMKPILDVAALKRDIKADAVKKKKRSKRKPRARKAMAHAKNATAVLNSVVDEMKIRTAVIEIPVIAEDVLTYEPGELGPAYPDKTRLFYSADAIKDPDYLESILHSPLQMRTHQKNTEEYNRDIDGWPLASWWDETERRVKLKGIVHGEENVKYAEENKHLPGFGTSAFISFLRIEKTAGTAPNGKPYDAVVRKAVNNHVAILPGIRDPKNVIVAMNAVEQNTVDNSDDDTKPLKKNGVWESPRGKSDAELDAIAKKAKERGPGPTGYADRLRDLGLKNSEGKKMEYNEFKGHMNAYQAEMKAEDERAEKIKNAIKNELKNESSKAVTSTATGAGNAPKSSGKDGEAKNFPHASEETSTVPAPEKKTETSTATNAMPSQEMVADFSTHLGIVFDKTPSLTDLGALVGIKASAPHELISALNAKREEIKKVTKPARSETGEAANSQSKTLDQVMAEA